MYSCPYDVGTECYPPLTVSAVLGALVYLSHQIYSVFTTVCHAIWYYMYSLPVLSNPNSRRAKSQNVFLFLFSPLQLLSNLNSRRAEEKCFFGLFSQFAVMMATWHAKLFSNPRVILSQLNTSDEEAFFHINESPLLLVSG